MTTVLDDNVHNLAVVGTFDDCQNIVKALFNDPYTNQTLKLGSFQTLKETDGFGPIPKAILEDGRRTFESDRVSDQETLETIKFCYKEFGYVLDPYTVVGITAAKRFISRAGSHMPHISLSTAHPTKFSQAVQLALEDEGSFDFDKSVLSPELHHLSQMEKRVIMVENSWEIVKEIIKKQVTEDRE
ncbi:MAG: hypothetical protein Q9175_007161 [Cornicularia normoerica]